MAPGARGAMELHLAFIANDGRVTRDDVVVAAAGLETACPFRPYLAEYGTGGMLAGWRSSGRLHLAVLDRATGEIVEGPVPIAANIDKWVAFVPFPGGDVGWA